MKISILGTGRMGRGIFQTIRPHAEEILLGSRNPVKPHTVSYEDALHADILIHAFWFRDLLPWAEQNREALRGKILVDISNPFTDDFDDFTLDFNTSAAEELQKRLPETKVVGAFKNTFATVLDQPLHDQLQSDIFVTSDDDEAKQQVMSLLQPLPFRILDGGRLRNNRTIERMTLFSRELSIRYGHYPYVSWRLWGN